MALASVLRYLYPSVPADSWRVEDRGEGAYIAAWSLPDPQPTARQISDAEASAGYRAWLAEHGGDPAMTRRRAAREALAGQDNQLIRAVVAVMTDELNRLRTQPATPFAALTQAQVRTAIIAKINSGSADT